MNTKENGIIKEKDYQKIKELLKKKDDYFTKEEINKYLQKNWRNFDVITMKKQTFICTFMQCWKPIKTKSV